MSSLTQLPAPAPAPTSTTAPAPNPSAAHFPPPSPNPAMLTVPVLQQPSPYWVDPSAVHPAPQPATQFHYITVAPPPSSSTPAAMSTSPSAPASDTLAPRPRKPYTTTKTREMWSPTEHERMLEGLRRFKRDWAKVTRFVGTRSAAQVRSHAQKYFDRVARDKTNDYVPRARPKRKSATPYPRKAREDAPQQQIPPQGPHVTHPVQMHHPSNSMTPLPMTIPVPSMHHPAAMSVQQQPTMVHGHPMHHPSVQIHLTAQSPLLQQMPSNSPCIAQPQQHNVSVQQGLAQHVYSPYVAMYPSSQPGQDSQRMQTSPVPHPSPMSFMGSPYTGHSPAPHQQLPVHQAHQQMYSMFSPLTPGGYPAGMSRAPAMNHGQVPLVAAPQMQTPVQHQHIPTHSHPGGPMENCAKCAALQRYGNVLQEIGEFRHPASPQLTQNVLQGVGHSAPGQAASNMPMSNYLQDRRLVENAPRTNATVRSNLVSSPSPERSGALSGKRSRGDLSCPSAEEIADNDLIKGAADHRAHRTKVMKARKAKNRSPIPKLMSKLSRAGDSEESNESINSSRLKNVAEARVEGRERKKDAANPSKTKVWQKKGSERPQTGVTPMKKPRMDGPTGERPTKRSRKPNQAASGKMTSSEDLSSTLPEVRNSTSHASGNSSPTMRIAIDKSEESDQKGANSPGVEAYSPSERKELFDAVKSLQILAKTSSSSPEPGSVGSEGNAEI